jgi:hypothetical protein
LHSLDRLRATTWHDLYVGRIDGPPSKMNGGWMHGQRDGPNVLEDLKLTVTAHRTDHCTTIDFCCLSKESA